MPAITPKNFWFWFGGIWFTVGAPFLVIGLYVGVQQATVGKRLDAEGKTVEGTVLTKARRTSSSGSGRSGGTTYEVTFRFLTADGFVQGRAEVSGTTWDSLVEREPIRVTYLPEAPHHHRIAGQANGWILPGIFSVVGGIVTTLGGFILWRARSRLRTTERLQREGVTTSATISDIRAANIRINGVRQVAVHYRYQDDRGQSYSGKETFSPEEAARWKEGDRTTVRYDRRKPAQSIWIGAP